MSPGLVSFLGETKDGDVDSVFLRNVASTDETTRRQNPEEPRHQKIKMAAQAQ
jgi:hypothetical protein